MKHTITGFHPNGIWFLYDEECFCSVRAAEKFLKKVMPYWSQHLVGYEFRISKL